MADDQNQKPLNTAQGKTTTIDDLVKELSKNSSSNQSRFSSATESGEENRKPQMVVPPEPPSNLPGIKIGGSPSISLNPMKPSESKPFSSSFSPLPKQSPVQEYRSSIRTMSEDIASIKSGQKPSGVDIPRKVIPDMPKTPDVSRLEASVSSGPMPSVGLGKTEKTGPLAGLSKPATVPSRPGPIVGIGQAGKTGPLPSSAPQKPLGPFKAPEIQPSVTIPGEKKMINMTFYLLIAGILVVGGLLYWYLVLRISEPESVLSPTPIPTPTSTAVIKNLNDTFEGTSINFEITLGENVSRDFKTFINTINVFENEFLQINLLTDDANTLVPISFFDVWAMDLVTLPALLQDYIVDSAVLVYGQSEVFSEDGSANFNVPNLKKMAFVARIRDVVAVEMAMKDWESTIAEDLADYMLIADTSKEKSVDFLDNVYRSVAIRYQNFPFPDTTVDYAVVKTAGQNYLIIAGSRETMYAAIDVLLEQ